MAACSFGRTTHHDGRTRTVPCAPSFILAGLFLSCAPPPAPCLRKLDDDTAQRSSASSTPASLSYHHPKGHVTRVYVCPIKQHKRKKEKQIEGKGKQIIIERRGSSTSVDEKEKKKELSIQSINQSINGSAGDDWETYAQANPGLLGGVPVRLRSSSCAWS